MSSSLLFIPGFGDSRQRNRFWRDVDGTLSTSVTDSDEDIRVILDLTDYLASGETVSSAAYEDSGITSSSKSVSTPQVLFTITGIGETKVTITLSTGREHIERVRTYLAQSNTRRRDYGD